VHEMALAEEVLQIVQDAARRDGCRRVRALWLEIGQLSSVEPEAMRFCFEAVARDGRERFGTERLIALVEENKTATPIAIRDRLMDAVTDFAAALDDDVTLLVARYFGGLS